MPWWLWAIYSAAGYEAVALVVARFTYRQVMFSTSAYGPKERHAGKAWALAHTWGLWTVGGPPALVLYVLCTCLALAGKGVYSAARWFIVSDDLSLSQFRPYLAAPELEEAATAHAEAKLGEVSKELDTLQGKVTDPDSPWEVQRRRDRERQEYLAWTGDPLRRWGREDQDDPPA
jgi:hypothetical protein